MLVCAVQTGLQNVEHVGGKDFTVVIDRALAMPGWTKDNMPREKAASMTGGRGAGVWQQTPSFAI